MAEEVARGAFLEEQVMPGRLRTSATTEEQAIAEANKFADDFNARNLVLEEYVRTRTQAGPVEFQNPELAEIQRAMTQRQETAYTPEETASLQRLAVARIPPQVDFGDDPGMAGMGMGGGLPSVRQVPFRPVPPRPDEERLREEFDEAMGVTDAGFDTALAQAKVAEEEQMAKSISDDLASFKIQPFRAYENTMFAVVAALSSALGAAAQSLTGVPNTAVKLINDAINKDVAAQKAQYNALKDKSQVQNNVYGQAMNSLNNAKAAERQARLGARKAYELRLDAIKKERRGAVELNAQIDMFNASNEAAMNKLRAGMAAKAAKAEDDNGYTATVREFADSALKITKELSEADIGVLDTIGLMGSKFTPAALGMVKPENRDLLRRFGAMQGSLNLVINAVMKSSGDAGALGVEERKIFLEDVKQVLPMMGFLEGLSGEAKRQAILKALESLAHVDKVLRLDPTKENSGQIRELIEKLSPSLPKRTGERAARVVGNPLNPLAN